MASSFRRVRKPSRVRVQAAWPRGHGALGYRGIRVERPEAPWWVVQAADKKRARLNCIAHLLAQTPYAEVTKPQVELPPRVRHPDYSRQPVLAEMFVPRTLLTPDRPAAELQSISRSPW